jgi:hypothetical protein
LATSGFSNDIPEITNNFYSTLVGTEYLGNIGKKVIGGRIGKKICGFSPYSWDTYIFHKSTLKNRLKEESFRRPNMNNEMVFFYMNEMGAENAALWSLQQSFPFKSIYNACDVIRSWHFHLTPKTHKNHETPWKRVGKAPPDSVPYPWGGHVENYCTGLEKTGVEKKRCRKSIHPIPSRNPPCATENNCFLNTPNNTPLIMEHKPLPSVEDNIERISNADVINTAQDSSPHFKVSYVTSFWAKEKGSQDINPHRREVEVALLANIYNRHFDQVVIFLDRDSVDKSETCDDFFEVMVDYNRQLGVSAENAKDLLQKVTCVDVLSGQPTYYQMFQNAVSDYVTSDVIVLANADMAFDDTISLARTLNPEVLVVAGSRGFTKSMPYNVKNIYHTLIGNGYIANAVKTKHTRRGEYDIDRCVQTNFSWDTWIFHKSKLGSLKEEDFRRKNINNEMVPFYMNENGAECAALWAVEQSYPFKSVYNACERIHSWSFHLTPKTHKPRTVSWLSHGHDNWIPDDSVPKPWGGSGIGNGGHPFPRRDPECVQQNDCFLQ